VYHAFRHIKITEKTGKGKGKIKERLNPAKAPRRKEKIKVKIKERLYPAEARRRREKMKDNEIRKINT